MPKPVSLRVDLDPDEWRRLRAAVALAGTSPRELATRLLRRELARLEKRKP